MTYLWALLALGTSFEPGKTAYEQGRMEEARTLLDRAVEEAPDDSEPYLYRALARDELGDGRGASADFERSLALRPDSAMAHYHLGDLLLNAGDLDAAQHHLEEALRLDPGYAWARQRMGDLLRKRGKVEEAAASYEASGKMDPEGGGWHSLGDLKLAGGDPEHALAAYEHDLIDHPECYEARINAAALLLAKGDAWGAAEHYGASLRYHPDDARAEKALARARRAIAMRYVALGAAPALLVGIVVGIALSRRRRARAHRSESRGGGPDVVG